MKSFATWLGMAVVAAGGCFALSGVAHAQSATCTFSGTAPSITITCVPSGSSSPGAPAPCTSLTTDAPPGGLPVGGGLVTLTANGCDPNTQKFLWSAIGQTSGTFNNTTSGATNNATITASTTFSVQSCLNDGVTCSTGVSSGQAIVASGGGGTPPPPTGLCANYPTWNVVQTSAMAWGAGFNSSTTARGGFATNTILVVPFTVPPGYSATGTGNFAIHEYGSAAISRTITLSTSPCDFRLNSYPDPTGNSGPMADVLSSGNIYWSLQSVSGTNPPVAKLVPGTTYYLNFANAIYYKGTLFQTCAKTASPCDVIVGQTNPSP